MPVDAGYPAVLGTAALFAIVMLAAGMASISLAPLFAGPPPEGTAHLVEATVGTTVFCASIGLIFHNYGPVAGASALLIAWLINRGACLRHVPAGRVFSWISAAALLLYISRIRPPDF